MEDSVRSMGLNSEDEGGLDYWRCEDFPGGACPGGRPDRRALILLTSGCSARFASLETFPAKDRASLGGAEGNGGFPPALGTNGGSFHASGRSTAFGRIILPLYLARFAAFWFIPEIFFVIKLLFARGEDKVRAAVHTF